MVFHPASFPSLLVFLLICGFVLVAFLRGIWVSAKFQEQPATPRTLAVGVSLLLWLAAAAVLVGSGWVEGAPPRLVVLGIWVFAGVLLIGFSPWGEALALAIPASWLLGFQGFRLPLELVLHSWVHQGVIPQTMTWTGANWDILSGILALGLAPFANKFKSAAWAGNAVGLILLINVGRVAALSAPLPFAWKDVTPRLLLPYHLPYALILPVCIGGALAGHIILTRALLRSKSP